MEAEPAFMGSPPMNLVEAKVSGRRVAFGATSCRSSGRSSWGLRRRHRDPGHPAGDFQDRALWHQPDHPVVAITVAVVEDLGSEVNLLFMVDAPPVETDDTLAAAGDEDTVPLPGEGGSQFCARVDARTRARAGQKAELTVDPERFHFFDPATGERVG